MKASAWLVLKVRTEPSPRATWTPASEDGLVGGAVEAAVAGRGRVVVGGGAVVEGDAQLVQVVLGLGAGGGLADLLDRGQEQADEDGDDGDDDQQLDEREAATLTTRGG